MKKSMNLFLGAWLASAMLWAQENPVTIVLGSQLDGSKTFDYQALSRIDMEDGFEYLAEQDNTFVASIGTIWLSEDDDGTSSGEDTGGPPSAHRGEVGGTNTSLTVTPSGSLAFEIPIIVSPGTNDMQPDLSIVYNSNAKDGILGRGFNLAGLSSVSRGPATMFHDSKLDPVDFDDNDRLVLDGERLIMVSSGTYGAPGTEYRFENNRYAKIEALGSGAYAESFKVYEKSGLIKTYGTTADAQVTRDGDQILWLINKVEDRAGNYMNIEYTNTGDEYYPSKIEYTGNTTASMLPYAYVQFVYEDRNTSAAMDPFYYVAGYEFKLTKRLLRIDSHYDVVDGLVRSYELNYSVFDRVPHLTSVVEKNGQGEKYTPTLFDWNDEGELLLENQQTITVLPFQPENLGGGTTSARVDKVFTGDFNGNGKDDMLVFHRIVADNDFTPGVDEFLYRRLYTFENGNWSQTWSTSWVDQGVIQTGDFNGDGLTDYVQLDADTEKAYVYLSDGSGFNAETEHTFLDYDYGSVGDFNGDGKSDLLFAHGGGTDGDGNPYSNLHLYYRNSSNGFTEATFNVKVPSYLEANLSTLVGDFNSDGVNDLFFNKIYDDVNPVDLDSRVYFFHEDDRFSYSGLVGFDFPDFEDPDILNNAVYGDYNGDGIGDFLIKSKFVGGVPADHWDLYFGTGTGFNKKEVSTLGDMQNYHAHVGDYNGDGHSDIALVHKTGLNTVNLYSFMHGEFKHLGTLDGVSGESAKFFSGDFTGNGVTDLFKYNDYKLYTHDGYCASNTTEECSLYDHKFNISTVYDYREEPLLIRALTNSYGSKTYVDYEPMTNPEVYTKGSGAAEPLVDVMMPMQVVSGLYQDNGRDDFFITRYAYEGALMHREGKGFLGFQKVITTDVTNGYSNEQVYEVKTSGFIPVQKSNKTTSITTGVTVSSSTFTYQNHNDGEPDTYIYAKTQSVDESRDAYTNQLLSTLTTDYVYDSNGNVDLLTQTYSSGHSVVTDNVYGQVDLPNWVLGRLTQATVTKTIPGGANEVRKSTFEYYSDGYLWKETIEPDEANKLVTEYTYDSFKNIESAAITGKVDATTNQTRTSYTYYDTKGRFPVQEINALSQEVNNTFDEVYGNIETATDPNGLITTYEYDNFGRLEKVISPVNSQSTTTTYQWLESTGLPQYVCYSKTTQTDGSAPIIEYYDRLGRVLRTVSTGFSGTQVLVDQVYDDRGRLKSVSDPYFSNQTPVRTYFTYDEVGRTIKTVDPAGRLTQNLYDGLLTTTINAKSLTNKKQVNVLGQTTGSEDSNIKSLTYTYHPNSQVETITDSETNVTTFEYDLFGNRTKVIDPDLGTMTYKFNAFGEVYEQTSHRNITTSFTFDLLGRMETRTIGSGGSAHTTTWVYDTDFVGALTSETVTSGPSKTYDYNTDGQLIQTVEVVDGKTYETDYTYDTYNRLEYLTYPHDPLESGFRIKHVYTTDGYLQMVQSGDGLTTYWISTGENARGQITGSSLGNGINNSYTYNSGTGYLETIQAEKETTLHNLAFGYDDLGNLTSRTDYQANGGLGLTEEFTYDDLSRLKTSAIQGKTYGGLSMTYDDLGNLTYKSDVGNYYYESSQPHAVSRIANPDSVITSYTQAIDYTGFDKVSLIRELDHLNGDAELASLAFTYGTSLERKITTTKVAGVETLKKLFIGGIYEEEIPASGDTRKLHYIMAGGEAIAIYTEEGASAAVNYLLKDHLGSVAAIADESGAIIERLSYNAWGLRRDADTWDDLSGSVNITFDRGFTGHEHLGLFALVNMNGRVYDPHTGRFLSADPYTQFPDFTQSLNRYSYVLNNPLSFTDPSGYLTVGQVFGAAASIIFAVPSMGTSTLVSAVLIGGFAGFMGSIVAASIDGATGKDLLKAGLKGGLSGGISGGLSFGIGDLVENVSASMTKNGLMKLTDKQIRQLKALQISLHAAKGGAVSSAFGGNFWSGALAAGAGSASSVNGLSPAAQVAVATAAGGLAAEIAGGNFADGAVMAAYTTMFNHLTHKSYLNMEIADDRKWNRKIQEQKKPPRGIKARGFKAKSHAEEYIKKVVRRMLRSGEEMKSIAFVKAENSKFYVLNWSENGYNQIELGTPGEKTVYGEWLGVTTKSSALSLIINGRERAIGGGWYTYLTSSLEPNPNWRMFHLPINKFWPQRLKPFMRVYIEPE